MEATKARQTTVVRRASAKNDGLPTEIGEMIMATLLVVARERNKAYPDRPEICIARQVDIPGKFKVFIDFPTENQAIRNKYLARLDVDLASGIIEFFPTGYPPSEKHGIKMWGCILERMIETIRSH